MRDKLCWSPILVTAVTTLTVQLIIARAWASNSCWLSAFYLCRFYSYSAQSSSTAATWHGTCTRTYALRVKINPHSCMSTRLFYWITTGTSQCVDLFVGQIETHNVTTLGVKLTICTRTLHLSCCMSASRRLMINLMVKGQTQNVWGHIASTLISCAPSTEPKVCPTNCYGVVHSQLLTIAWAYNATWAMVQFYVKSRNICTSRASSGCR